MANEAAESAEEPRTVPVLDLHLFTADSVGNPFRSYNKREEKWRPMTTREAWMEHPNPHVLPVNGDYDTERVIPAAEYDGDLPLTPEALADDEEALDEPENIFECPSCGAMLTGYPDSCANCDAEFSW